MKPTMKRMLSLVLAGAFVFSSCDFTAFAATQDAPMELEPMRVFADPYSDDAGIMLFTETNEYLPKLKDGNYVKWIDRVELSEDMRNFHNLLEEASDNDGKDDFLIDPDDSKLVLEIDEGNGK